MLLYSFTASCRHPKNPQDRTQKSAHSKAEERDHPAITPFPTPKVRPSEALLKEKHGGRSTTQKSFATFFSSVLNIYIKPVNNINV